MKKIIRVLLIWLVTLSSCQHQPNEKKDDNLPLEEKKTQLIPIRDLKAIKESGELVAITAYNSTSYFIFKGQPMGYEYELLERLADYLDVKLQIIIARDMNQLFELLEQGKGDIIAYALTITQERNNRVAFTHPHNQVEQVLVQRRPKNWRQMTWAKMEKSLVRNVIDLIGKEVHVKKESPYYLRLQNLMEELGDSINIKIVSESISTEDLIRKVARGEIPYTVADKNIALLNKTYYDNIDVGTPISFPQRIAWAVGKESPNLLSEVNNWIDSMKHESDYYVIYNKYFKNRKTQGLRVASDYFSQTGDKISPYDSTIMEFSKELHWDWLLLASQIYQESRFDPNAESWVGAMGLMQLMPATADLHHIEDPTDPYQSIQGGTRHMQILLNYLKEVPDSTQRIKMAMAAYNIGYGHIIDARNLATKYGGDPNKWDGEVEQFLMKKSKREYFSDPIVKHGYCRGLEPVAYVREVFDRYNHYRQLYQ